MAKTKAFLAMLAGTELIDLILSHMPTLVPAHCLSWKANHVEQIQ